MKKILVLAAACALALSLSTASSSAAPSPEQPPVATPTTGPEKPLPITMVKRPKIAGQLKYGKTVKVTNGRWSVSGLTYSYRWFRSGKPIKGATKKTYRLKPADVGRSIRVRVKVAKKGYTPRTVTTKKRKRVAHAKSARRTVKYQVAYRGKITTSKKTFRKQVHATLNDARGWRAGRIAFKRVSKGGAFTVYLAEARTVPSFSSFCSTQWSCRVGNAVVINQDRWKNASPAWRQAKGSVRGYRHMVVNHEVGHWLGWYHNHCSGKGKKAPVMQTQSKGLAGCSFNPWPLSWELKTPRFGKL